MIKAVLFSLSVFSISTQAFAMHPDCALPNSDPDGDGYGWENGNTCIVVDVTSPQTPDGDLSNCDYSNAVNGWGWNPITRQSCPPLTDLVEQVSTLANGLQAEISGVWRCRDMNMTADYTDLSNNQAGCYIDSSRRDTSSSLCDVSWTTETYFQRVSEPLVVSSYGIWFKQDGTYSNIFFGQSATNPNPQSSINLSPFNLSGSWSVTNDGYSVEVDGVKKQKIGFEVFNGTKYMHLYDSDEYRTTCTKS